MKRKKRGLIFICIGIVVLFLVLFIVSKKMFQTNEYSLHKKTDNYEYNINNIKTGSKIADKEMKEYIKNKISFIEKKTKYKLDINYTITEYKKILTYDFKETEYHNLAQVNEEHKIYSIKDGQLVTVENIFNKKTNYKTYLKDRLYYFIKTHMYQNNIELDEKKLNKYIKNPNNFYINSKGINFIINLSNISNSPEVIEKTFTYPELSDYLQDEFKKYINESFEKTRVDRNIEEFKEKKVVAITFDDGPSNATTPRLLDELNKRDIKVTFFVVGKNVEKNPDIIKRIYLEGHDIGIHTYSHPNLTKLPDEEIQSQKESVVNIIKSIIDYTPVYLRPPYGSIDDRVKSIYPMKNILWNVDSEDWKSKNADAILNQILSTTDDGDIVLLHDIYDTSVDGAIKTIDELSKQGYLFVTISELLQIKGDTKDTYYGF